MPAEVVTIAEAVKSKLATATLSQAFSVERTYLPAHQLDNLTTAKCAVVGVDATEDALTRTKVDGRYEVQVGFAKRTGTGIAATNDAMLLLIQEAADLFWLTLERKLPTVPGATLMQFRFSPLYDLNLLRETGVLFGVLSLVYRKSRGG